MQEVPAAEKPSGLGKVPPKATDKQQLDLVSASRAPPQPPAGRPYHIDAEQLVPKPSLDVSRWKEAHPAEYRALVAQGETVSPSKNLLKVGPGGKRKRADQVVGAGKRVARADDSNDRVFERRQRRWASAAPVHSGALAPKCQPDGGPEVPRVKAQAGDGGAAAAVATEAAAGAAGPSALGPLHEDVRVAEGLRCPRWLWEALYPYQQECVAWLWGLQRERSGGILADEMGLGKTIQIVAYLAALHHSGILQSMRIQNTSLGTACAPSLGGVLVICPATLIAQWRNEFHLWYPPLRICVMHQVGEQERKETIRTASSQLGVLITSYETMRIALDDLLATSWVMLILDEGQKIRNPNASITLAVKRFSTPHRIVLSGSPIQNNLREFWSLFDFICPGRLGTLPVFLEEIGHPIEVGGLQDANQARAATAYHCALTLRELTQPCILRRTKAECMDVLRLTHKQEQVLFCNLTPEQYQVYVDFLQTEHVRKAKAAKGDNKLGGAVFFAISVLRKLCNHPDLLLQNAEEDLKPPDMWNFERSGKMKVLAEILRLWHSEHHRALIFVQTIQMLNVIERWMDAEGFSHLRIDGKTPVKRRLQMIEEYNGNGNIFAMILTTRVGGVGLNIIGADRVIIFDPDWNPMTDVQARERAWRIGQRRDVAVYRLILTGTLEEKVYQRQVYKHFLSQKVLSDPRQRQFFKWNDLADLFDVPLAPPGFDPGAMAALKEKHKTLFGKVLAEAKGDELEVETIDVMKEVASLPAHEQNMMSKQGAEEHNTILQTLYDSNGIKASFNHDKVEQPLLDRKIVRDGASAIAKRALDALQRSARERGSHHISEPTWTGQRGSAGTSLQATLKREEFGEEDRGPSLPPTGWSEAAGTHAASADILEGLRQLGRMRAAESQQRGATQAEEAARLGLAGGRGAKSEAAEANPAGLRTELLPEDRKIAELIFQAFLSPTLAGEGHSITTGQVIQHLGRKVAAHSNDLFKALLQEMCQLSRPALPNMPGVWTLRREFWPRRGATAVKREIPD